MSNDCGGGGSADALLFDMPFSSSSFFFFCTHTDRDRQTDTSGTHAFVLLIHGRPILLFFLYFIFIRFDNSYSPATRVYSCKTLFFFSSVTRNVCQCHSLARSPAKKEIKKRKGNDFASPFSFYCKSAASTAFLLRLWRFGTRKYHGIISNPTRHLFILVSQRRFLLFIIGLLSVDLFLYSVCLYYSSHHIVLVPSSLFLVHIL